MADSNQQQNQIRKMIPRKEEQSIDECVITYMDMKGQKDIADKFRTRINHEQDEVMESMQQNGDFPQYSINSIKSFFQTNSMIYGGAGNSDFQSNQAIFNGDSPEHFTESFKLLKKYIDQSLDQYKEELQTILFPTFVHLFLNMIKNKFNEEARQFFLEEKSQFISNHKEDISILEQVDYPSKFTIPEVAKYINNKFVVKMSLYSFQLLLHFVKLNQFILVMSILNQNIEFQLSGDKNAIDARGLQSVLVSEPIRDINKTDLVLGKLPEFSPEFAAQGNSGASNQEMQSFAAQNQQQLSGIQGQMQQDQQQQIKKGKRALQNILTDPQIPLPKFDEDLQNKIYSELNQQVKLGEKALPSIASIDLFHTYRQLTGVTLSDSGLIMVCGFSDSSIKVFLLDPEQQDIVTSRDILLDQIDPNRKLIPPPSQQQQQQQKKKIVNPQTHTLNMRESKQDLEDKRIQREFVLIGHSGPVYGLSVSIDDKMLLSGSFDTTIRLWSLQQKALLSIFHGHSFPVWNVQFSPLGTYFVSSSNDRTAKLWQTKQHVPLRIFVGHLSDVDAIEFHPNIHYVATGSNDKQIRLWSCSTGQCVRIMLTVNGTVRSLKFSRSGNYLMSGNDYGEVVVFDVNKATPLEVIQTTQNKAIWSMDISWDDQILAVGTEDSTIELYSFQRTITSSGKGVGEVNQRIPGKSSSPSFLKSYKTKSNGVLVTKYTWRNFLYTIGCVERNYY